MIEIKKTTYEKIKISSNKTPKIILYIPKNLKSLVLIYFNKNLITNNETKKETIIPMKSNNKSVL